jgi:hypothetical protein
VKFYKTVLMPIEVCVGDYCWGDRRICGHFSNEGGHPTCDLKFDLPYKADMRGRVLKPKECKNLPEVS